MVSALNKNNPILITALLSLWNSPSYWKHWACKIKGWIGLSLPKWKRVKCGSVFVHNKFKKEQQREWYQLRTPMFHPYCHWEQFFLCHWKYYSPRMLNTGSIVEHRTLLGLTPPVRFPCTNWPSPVQCPPPFNKYTQGTRTKWMKWMQLIR